MLYCLLFYFMLYSMFQVYNLHIRHVTLCSVLSNRLIISSMNSGFCHLLHLVKIAIISSHNLHCILFIVINNFISEKYLFFRLNNTGTNILARTFIIVLFLPTYIKWISAYKDWHAVPQHTIPKNIWNSYLLWSFYEDL